MVRQIDRHDVLGLAAEGAQIIDVLPQRAYQESHIAGALSIPLRRLTRDTADRLRRTVPAIVYCNDYT